MARRVFFSFHYDDDVWRANQVRNSNVVAGADVAGFFDHSEYQEAKKEGKTGIENMIRGHLRNTSVTVVLMGTHTWERPWVKFEISESAGRKNGFLGIYIHHLKNQQGVTSMRGSKAAVPSGVEFPCYDWDGDLDRLRREIEAAGQRADKLRQ
ncbi:MAG: TIR domain-containing protein [Deltaproteobacteria bacterium]|nr:TIR domain-containing protein [Deltaproteobacteria bacterium]